MPSARCCGRGGTSASGFGSLLLILSLTACRPGSRTTVTLAGSTSVQPFAERLAEIYVRSHPEVEINVQGGGSSAGIRAVHDGICQIGMSSRNLAPEEKGLQEIPIALDGIVLIVNQQNPVMGLNLEQARAVFAGAVRDWSKVGGAHRRITLVTREEGSGTRASFEQQVMTGDGSSATSFARDALVQDSNGAVREIVASDPDAIGYISFGLVDQRVRPLTLDGVAPSEETIKQGRYPVVRRFLFLLRHPTAQAAPTRQQEAMTRFLNFVLGPAGQKVLVDEGLVSILP